MAIYNTALFCSIDASVRERKSVLLRCANQRQQRHAASNKCTVLGKAKRFLGWIMPPFCAGLAGCRSSTPNLPQEPLFRQFSWPELVRQRSPQIVCPAPPTHILLSLALLLPRSYPLFISNLHASPSSVLELLHPPSAPPLLYLSWPHPPLYLTDSHPSPPSIYPASTQYVRLSL